MSATDLLEAGVNSLEAWFRAAPPEKGEFHWKDGRSAKEVARGWLRTGTVDLPDEVREALDLHTATRLSPND